MDMHCAEKPPSIRILFAYKAKQKVRMNVGFNVSTYWIFGYCLYSLPKIFDNIFLSRYQPYCIRTTKLMSSFSVTTKVFGYEKMCSKFFELQQSWERIFELPNPCIIKSMLPFLSGKKINLDLGCIFALTAFNPTISMVNSEMQIISCSSVCLLVHHLWTYLTHS